MALKLLEFMYVHYAFLKTEKTWEVWPPSHGHLVNVKYSREHPVSNRKSCSMPQKIDMRWTNSPRPPVLVRPAPLITESSCGTLCFPCLLKQQVSSILYNTFYFRIRLHPVNSCVRVEKKPWFLLNSKALVFLFLQKTGASNSWHLEVTVLLVFWVLFPQKIRENRVTRCKQPPLLQSPVI